MRLTQYHQFYEVRVHFKYNDNYTGGGVCPDSFIEQFYAVSYNGAMKTANALVAIEERECRKCGYIDLEKVTLTLVAE